MPRAVYDGEQMVETLAPDDLIEEALSADALRRGTRLARYELLVPIAKGGMARVWAARLHGQRGFSKTVAIKTILPHLAEEPEFERMFLDEARIAALVHHPNVCEIYELGEEGKVLYIVMEWVNGESLIQLLRSSGKMAPMDARLAARIVADACAGLHAAHQLTDDDGRSLGVVHRDVSPHNILVSADGQVKVADFGVAKALGQAHSATQAGQAKGKMAYMAPEQIAGQADRRSDVFSMGIVLYEATTGKRPYAGANDAETMHQILAGQYMPPSRIIRGYPPELEQIVARAMASDPAQRFQTAEKMRVALEEWLARSGSIVTSAMIGSFVQQRIGADLEKRREKIRVAASASVRTDDASSPGMPGSSPNNAGVSTGTPSVQSAVDGVQSGQRLVPAAGSGSSNVGLVGLGPQSAAAPPSTGKYVLAAVVGILVAVGVGTGAILYLRNKSDDGFTSRGNATATGPSAKASDAPKATAPAAPVRTGAVAFSSLPPDAVLIVDGMLLDRSARSVERPPPGSKRTVIIRDPGFLDETVTIDDTTPPSLDVTLTIGSPSALPTQTAAAATNTGSPTSPTGTGSSKKPPNVALPQNPY